MYNIYMDKTRHKRYKSKNKSAYKTLKCSPSSNSVDNNTCYSSKSLHKLKEHWNARHPDKLIATNDPREIWNSLKMYMGDVCNTEQCWLNQKFIKGNLNKELLNYTFAPTAPDTWKLNPNEWLNSLDILQVMKQYEKAYSKFVFIGPTPIDFDKKKLYGECVWEELCNFSLNKMLQRGKTKIGIIFNLDPHYKPGSHWVALYIDLNKKYMFHFDSNGDKIHRNIKNLVKRIKGQGEQLSEPINLRYGDNYKFEHQKRNTECGIYSMYFIIEQLKGVKEPDYFKKYKITDEDMEKFRNKYYNN